MVGRVVKRGALSKHASKSCVGSGKVRNYTADGCKMNFA